LLAVVGVVCAVQTALLWRLSSGLRSIERMQTRLSHFAEALALLTDTTEAGLAAVAGEIDRPTRRRAPRASARNPRTRRIVSEIGRGRSLDEIAADEGLSTSEVRLHLDLSKDVEVTHGAMCG
jgi:hypothetical protein